MAKAAKRGDAASTNAGLIDKVANGELSEEQLDVIADAASKTEGAAALDTDFIKLALLCESCHTELHAENQTLYRDLRGVWQTRPALPDETPPARPDRNRPQRE